MSRVCIIGDSVTARYRSARRDDLLLRKVWKESTSPPSQRTCNFDTCDGPDIFLAAECSPGCSATVLQYDDAGIIVDIYKEYVEADCVVNGDSMCGRSDGVWSDQVIEIICGEKERKIFLDCAGASQL